MKSTVRSTVDTEGRKMSGQGYQVLLLPRMLSVVSKALTARDSYIGCRKCHLYAANRVTATM